MPALRPILICSVLPVDGASMAEALIQAGVGPEIGVEAPQAGSLDLVAGRRPTRRTFRGWMIETDVLLSRGRAVIIADSAWYAALPGTFQKRVVVRPANDLDPDVFEIVRHLPEEMALSPLAGALPLVWAISGRPALDLPIPSGIEGWLTQVTDVLPTELWQRLVVAPAEARGAPVAIVVDRDSLSRATLAKLDSWLEEVQDQLAQLTLVQWDGPEAQARLAKWADCPVPGLPAVNPGTADDGLSGILGQSDATRALRKRIRLFADAEAPVLISGETGTGKEAVAKALHEHSGRASKPFIVVDCGAIPSELVESELFGHEKGAFTGATKSRRGPFERADGGTVFLDEIGELPLAAQVKLLRVLQEKTVRRVGGERELEVAFRMVAATNRDLQADVEGGRFRHDLLPRINELEIRTTPLAERPTDVPDIARSLVHRRERTISEEALQALASHRWGIENVRGLLKTVGRALTYSQSEHLTAKDLDHPDLLSTKEVRPWAALEELRAAPRPGVDETVCELGKRMGVEFPSGASAGEVLASAANQAPPKGGRGKSDGLAQRILREARQTMGESRLGPAVMEEVGEDFVRYYSDLRGIKPASAIRAWKRTVK